MMPVSGNSVFEDHETKLWTNKGTEEPRLSLRGVVSDEAIAVFGQRLLRSARNDTLTLCYAVGILSHSPKPDSDLTKEIVF